MPLVKDYQLRDMTSRANDLYALRKYEIILDWLNEFASLKILNVGCGSGELSHLLTEKGHEVIGIDPNEQYIEIAQKQTRELNLKRCSFQVSSLENYPADELFDVVIATDVIEHIEDEQSALKKLVSLIKPNGFLVISVPAEGWLEGYHDKMLGHYRRYSLSGLKSLLKSYLQLKKIRYFGFSLIPICVLYSKILRKEYPVAKSGDSARHLQYR